MEYLIAFKPVSAKAIRIMGEVSGGEHWFSKDKTPCFSSITELSIHGTLPKIEKYYKK